MDMQFDLFDKEANQIFEIDNYKEFRDVLRSSGCAKCALSDSRTNIVVDRGNPNSKIMMIGEGPGENEDRQGKAFVGRAGKMLDEVMKTIGIDTNNDTLIANVVKCRPPENRSPKTEEAKTCMPYLTRQIDLIKPKIILLLGAVALKYLMPEKKDFSMENEVGKFFTRAEYPGINFMVLYHPAFLLYYPSKKKDMWEHVKVLKNFIREKGDIFL